MFSYSGSFLSFLCSSRASSRWREGENTCVECSHTCYPADPRNVDDETVSGEGKKKKLDAGTDRSPREPIAIFPSRFRVFLCAQITGQHRTLDVILP